MKSIDPKILIKKLKAGHEESFTLLYDAYGSKIFNLAYRMVGNKEDAEDITQETLLKAYQGIENFKGESQLYTWIYTIAKNVCYRFFQQQKKSSFAYFEELIHSTQDQSLPAEITNWEKKHLIHQVKDGCLTGLLRCLSFYQRTAFILHVLLYLPVRDVAQILAKSEGATKVLIHRARENLKKFLCKNCSLYKADNSCQCDSLLGFSLKQGWITRPPKKELNRFVDSNTIENEIEGARKIVKLYTSLSEPTPPEHFINQIQNLIKNQDWAIFSNKKV